MAVQENESKSKPNKYLEVQNIKPQTFIKA